MGRAKATERQKINNLVKLAGSFVNPKGITLHKNLPWGIEKEVLGLLSSFTCICRNSDNRSRIENLWAPPKASSMSYFRGSGMASLILSTG